MKKEQLLEEQLLEEKELSGHIEAGEIALAKYQEMFDMIEESSYNLGKNLEVLDDESVQSQFQKMLSEREETTRATNRMLESMNEDLLEMKKQHKKELEDFEETKSS